MVGVKRVLINGLAVLSAVLFVAACAMWVRSSHVADTVILRFGRFAAFIDSASGVWSVDLNFPPGDRAWEFHSVWHTSGDVGWRFLLRAPGFSKGTTSDPVLGWTLSLSVPYWFLLILFSIAPLTRWRMMRCVVAAGLCPQCGYDLRATPERCPECGFRTSSAKEGPVR